MRLTIRHRCWRALGRAAVLALMALCLLGLVVEGIPPAHSHEEDGEPGFYYAECMLVLLAASHLSAPVPIPLSAAWVVLLALVISYSTTPRLTVASLRFSESRAPPSPRLPPAF